VRHSLAANERSSEFFTLKMDVTYSSETSVLQEPHGVAISYRTAFFIATAVKTSYLTGFYLVHTIFKNQFLIRKFHVAGQLKRSDLGSHY
jgi:hypothetical protein